MEKQQQQDYDYLLVVDFECTCDRNNPKWKNEIIEFPIVLIDVIESKTVDEFRTFVRPEENPTLLPFCTELTGIQQTDINDAPSLEDTLKLVHKWMETHNLFEKKFAFVTDGPWDLREFLEFECRRRGIEKPSYFDQWVNIRWLFAEFYKTRRMGVRKMLSRQNANFLGQLHSGIDDSRNIAFICMQMIRDGCKIVVNDSLTNPIDGGSKKM